MGSKYTTQSTSGYNASPPPDDGTQVASNLVTWAGVKTKLADVLKTFGEAINTALVSALDLSARAISTPDTAVASDHWKTLQVTGNTTITLSSAASMGAGYEVGIFNAGTGVVTVTPGAAADTINGVSASVTVSIKGTKIFRTNQALTGYNVVGGYDPQTITATTVLAGGIKVSAGTGTTAGSINLSGGTQFQIIGGTSGFSVIDSTDSFNNLGMSDAGNATIRGSAVWGTGVANFGTITKRKTADESVTSSTVLQDDDHLTFAIAANEEWVATFYVRCGNLLTTTGIKIAITTPGGATFDANAMMGESGSGNAMIVGNASTSGGTLWALNPSAGIAGYFSLTVWVLNGATPGSITLQWAQNSSSGTALTFFKGAFLQATRVA